MEKKTEDMKKKMEDMNNDVTYLKQVQDKVGQNLELLGLQVENLRNKEKQAKPSQQAQTEITAEDIFVRTEDKIAANTLIDIHHQSQIQSMEEVDTNVQQVRQTNITTNLPIKQIVLFCNGGGFLSVKECFQ